MTLHGHEEDLALSGGEVPDSLCVALGDAAVDEGIEGFVLRFSDTRLGPDELLIGINDEGLWRRSPWPAADELFGLPLPEADAPVLVVGGDEAHRSRLAAAASEREIQVITDDRLRRSVLEQVATVAFLEDGGRFPPHAFPVAAAARAVILRAPQLTFGFHDGVDCVVVPDDDVRMVEAIDAVATYGAAFTTLRRSGRLTAGTQRASEVYARLATDLALGLVGVARNDRSASST